MLHCLEPGTRNTYDSGFQCWLFFCETNGHNPIPTAKHIQEFIIHLSLSGYRYNTISNYLSGIRSWCLIFNLLPLWNSITESSHTQLIRQAARKRDGKLFGSHRHRKPPISLDHLDYIERHINWSYDNILFYTILTVGYFGLFRLGELVFPDDPSLRDWGKIILRLHTIIDVHSEFAKLNLRYMKNDRFYDGNTVIIFHSVSERGPDPILCLERYLAARDTAHREAAPLFLKANGDVPTRSWFINLLKHWLGPDFAGHSLRSGGATGMALDGLSEATIQRRGRWRSEAWRLYLRRNPELENIFELRRRRQEIN